jgi:cytoskeletal protein RodZ
MIGIIWSFITTRIPLKTWLIIIAILSLVGVFFWFKHSIYNQGKSDAETACVAEKNEEIKAITEKSKQNQKSRERTDANVRKMSNSDVDDALQLGGWLRD